MASWELELAELVCRVRHESGAVVLSMMSQSCCSGEACWRVRLTRLAHNVGALDYERS